MSNFKIKMAFLGSCGLLLFFSAYFKDHFPYGFPINSNLTIIVPVLIGYFFYEIKWWLSGTVLIIASQIAGECLREPGLLDLTGTILFYFYPMIAWSIVGRLFQVGVQENGPFRTSKTNLPVWYSLVYFISSSVLIGIYAYWRASNQDAQKIEEKWGGLKLLIEPLGFGILGLLIPNVKWLVWTFLSTISVYLTIFLVRWSDPLIGLIILFIPLFGVFCVAGFYLRILLMRQLVH